MDTVSIVILGSGNVATHLANALDKEYKVVQVFSRHINNAHELASTLKDCSYTDKIDKLIRDADLYLISVCDDAIEKIANDMPEVKGIVAHTSGSVDIHALNGNGRSQGVFYPLQTFSKDKSLDISKVPFFIEASDSDTEKSLKDIASALSEKVYSIDSAQRQTLHLAAVFACNFFNHMLTVSSRILNTDGIGIDVMLPLIEATINKAMTMSPHEAQTGPAARRDFSTITKHLDLLQGYDKEIYSIVTKAIIAETKKSERMK